MYHITYGVADDEVTPDLSDSIVAVMRQVELSLSPFEDESLISAINRCESDSVDAMLVAVFSASEEVNLKSGGRFDPTVGPLVDLWGFGTRGKVDRVPSQSQIDSALMSVGFADCRIVDGHLVKKCPSTRFNFSAITKGFGCDCVAALMRRNGVENYMIEIGGEIALGGKSPRGTDWRIQIDTPEPNDTAVVHSGMTMVDLTDCGIATSGNYRNFNRFDTLTVGHTINPLTGIPFRSEIASATVIAPDCMLADAYATAIMAMPLDSARAMIDSTPYLSAMIVTTDTAGNFLPIYVRFPVKD